MTGKEILLSQSINQSSQRFGWQLADIVSSAASSELNTNDCLLDPDYLVFGQLLKLFSDDIDSLLVTCHYPCRSLCKRQGESLLVYHSSRSNE